MHPIWEHSERNIVIDEVTGTSKEYRHLICTPAKVLWIRALVDDLGKLVQGVGAQMKKGTNTIRFVPRWSVPKDQKVTYARIVASLHPTKNKYIKCR